MLLNIRANYDQYQNGQKLSKSIYILSVLYTRRYFMFISVQLRINRKCCMPPIGTAQCGKIFSRYIYTASSRATPDDNWRYFILPVCPPEQDMVHGMGTLISETNEKRRAIYWRDRRVCFIEGKDTNQIPVSECSIVDIWVRGRYIPDLFDLRDLLEDHAVGWGAVNDTSYPHIRLLYIFEWGADISLKIPDLHDLDHSAGWGYALPVYIYMRRTSFLWWRTSGCLIGPAQHNLNTALMGPRWCTVDHDLSDVCKGGREKSYFGPGFKWYYCCDVGHFLRYTIF